jgi:hypothetical protein
MSWLDRGCGKGKLIGWKNPKTFRFLASQLISSTQDGHKAVRGLGLGHQILCGFGTPKT